MKFSYLVMLSLALFSCSDKDDDTPSVTDVVIIDTTTNTVTCDVDNTVDQTTRGSSVDHTTDAFNSTYTETTNLTERIINSNQIPNHDYDAPPNNVLEQNKTFRMDKEPATAGTVTHVLGDSRIDWVFGIALNGCKLDPAAAFPYENTQTGEDNWDWVLEGTNNASMIGLDANHAHLQANGAYHYHGDFSGYAEDILNADGSTMVQCGWAADGFPIYYKYAYTSATDVNSEIREMISSYRIIEGNRPGDGVSAPCGEYNGKYEQDYEYNSAFGDLDECNGRVGVTPEFPNGTYYYLITSDFPLIPRCFKGTPNATFGL